MKRSGLSSLCLLAVVVLLSGCMDLLQQAKFYGPPATYQPLLKGDVGVMTNTTGRSTRFNYHHVNGGAYDVETKDLMPAVAQSTMDQVFETPRPVENPSDAPLVIAFDLETPGWSVDAGGIINAFAVSMKTTAFVDGEAVAFSTASTSPFYYSSAVWGNSRLLYERADKSVTNAAGKAAAEAAAMLMGHPKVAEVISSSNNPEHVGVAARNLNAIADFYTLGQQTLAEQAGSDNTFVQGLATFGATLGGAAAQAYAAQNAPRPATSSSGAGDPRAQCDGPLKQQLNQQWQAGCAQNANNMGCNDIRRMMRACGM